MALLLPLIDLETVAAYNFYGVALVNTTTVFISPLMLLSPLGYKIGMVPALGNLLLKYLPFYHALKRNDYTKVTLLFMPAKEIMDS
jgi:hypothetical protein